MRVSKLRSLKAFMEKYYGFKSYDSLKIYPNAATLYEKPDGSRVVVTCVIRGDPLGKDYEWRDKKCVSEVTKCVRGLAWEEAFANWSKCKL